jgi:hypothetical protein
VNYTTKAAVFVLAVETKPTKRAKTKAGMMSRSEKELLEMNEQLAATSLGYGGKSFCRIPLLMMIYSLHSLKLR